MSLLNGCVYHSFEGPYIFVGSIIAGSVQAIIFVIGAFGLVSDPDTDLEYPT
jgi:hypothetical protein